MVWDHLCQTSGSATDLFTSILTSLQTKCKIPMKVLTFSGISNSTTLNHSRKRVTDSINCEKISAASASVHLEQPPMPSTPDLGAQQELNWCVFVCVGISLIDKSRHWAWMRIFPSSYHITSFKIKEYLLVYGSTADACSSSVHRL